MTQKSTQLDEEFQDVQGRYNGPELEKATLQFWQENEIFEKTLEQSEGRPRFSFNEGPPTANGKPGIHHVLARSFKDIYPPLQNHAGFPRTPQRRLGYPWPTGRA